MQATFSIRQPDANGILAEKNDRQNGRLRPQIQPQGLRAKLEGTWGSGLQILIERWRHHDNTARPYNALGFRPPAPESSVPIDQWPLMH